MVNQCLVFVCIQGNTFEKVDLEIFCADVLSFLQFTDATFRCVMKLLDTVMISLRDTAREIARAISALVSHIASKNFKLFSCS